VRVLDDPAEESCPVCAIPLQHAILARERIRYCTRCRGMLIQIETFGVLLEELKHQTLGTAIPQPPEARELERRIRCPRRHEPMDTHYCAGPGNIVIDDCSHCCLNWLDSGEVIRIVRAPDRSYDEALGPGLDASAQPW
jgi:Zn-finger nucleic acid-binding protein